MEGVPKAALALVEENAFLLRQISDLSYTKTVEINGMRNRIVGLESKLSISNAELTASIDENNLLRKQVSNLTISISNSKTSYSAVCDEWKEKYAFLQNQLNTNATVKEELTTEHNATLHFKSQEIDSINYKVTELETVLAIVKNDSNSNFNEISTLLSTLVTEQDTFKALLLELNSSSVSQSIGPEFDQCKQSLHNSHNKVESIIHEMKQKVEKLLEISSESTDLFSTINKLTNENKSIKNKAAIKLKRSNDALLKLQNELILQNSAVIAGNNRVNELQQSLLVSEQNLTRLEAQHKAEIDWLQQQIASSKVTHCESIARLTADYQASLTENNALSAAIADKQHQIDTLTTQLREMEAKYADAMTQCGEVQRQLQAAHAHSAQLAADHNAELRQRNSDHSSAIERLSMEHTERYRVLNEQREKQTAELSTTTQELSTTKLQLHSTNDQLVSVQQDHAALLNQHNTLQETSRDSSASYERRIRDLDESLAELNLTIAQQHDELSMLVTASSNRISEVTVANNSIKDEKSTLQSKLMALELNFEEKIAQMAMLQSQIVTLESQIVTLESQIVTLETSGLLSSQTSSCHIESLQSTINTLHTKNNELTISCNDTSRLLSLKVEDFDDNLCTDYADLSNKNKQLADQLSAANDQIAEYMQLMERNKSELSKMSVTLAANTTQIAELQAVLSEKETALGTAQQRVAELTSSIDSKATKFKANQFKVAELERSLAEVRAQSKMLTEQHLKHCSTLQMEHNSAVVALENEKSQLSSELVVLQTRCTQLSDDLAQQTTLQRATEMELTETQTTLAAASHTIDDLQQTLSALRNDTHNEQTTQLQIIATLNSNTKTLSAANQSLVSQLDTKQNDYDELYSECLALKLQCDTSANKTTELASIIAQLESNVAALDAQNSELKKQLESANALALSLQNELLSAQASHTTLNNQYVTLQDTVAALEQTISTLRTDKLELQSEIDQLTAQQSAFSELSEINAALNEEVSAYEQQLNTLGGLVIARDSTITALQQTVHTLEREIVSHKDTATELRSELASLTVSLSDLQTASENRIAEHTAVVAVKEAEILDLTESEALHCEEIAVQQSIITHLKATISDSNSASESSAATVATQQQHIVQLETETVALREEVVSLQDCVAALRGELLASTTRFEKELAETHTANTANILQLQGKIERRNAAIKTLQDQSLRRKESSKRETNELSSIIVSLQQEFTALTGQWAEIHGATATIDDDNSGSTKNSFGNNSAGSSSNNTRPPSATVGIAVEEGDGEFGERL